jgi:hypothetical protein
MIRLYKSGDNMGIGTDCKDIQSFLEQLSALLAHMIDEDMYQGNWEYQFLHWLPQISEICCQLKGHRAEVTERSWILTCSGRGAPMVASTDDVDSTHLINPFPATGN